MVVKYYREDYSQADWHKLITGMCEDVPELLEDTIDGTGEFMEEYSETLGVEVYEYETYNSIEGENNFMYSQKVDENILLDDISCPHCKSFDVNSIRFYKKWQMTKFLKTNLPNQKVNFRQVDVWNDLKGCDSCHTFFVASTIPLFNNEETARVNNILKNNSTREKIVYFLK